MYQRCLIKSRFIKCGPCLADQTVVLIFGSDQLLQTFNLQFNFLLLSNLYWTKKNIYWKSHPLLSSSSFFSTNIFSLSLDPDVTSQLVLTRSIIVEVDKGLRIPNKNQQCKLLGEIIVVQRIRIHRLCWLKNIVPVEDDVIDF